MGIYSTLFEGTLINDELGSSIQKSSILALQKHTQKEVKIHTKEIDTNTGEQARKDVMNGKVHTGE